MGYTLSVLLRNPAERDASGVKALLARAVPSARLLNCVGAEITCRPGGVPCIRAGAGGASDSAFLYAPPPPRAWAVGSADSEVWCNGGISVHRAHVRSSTPPTWRAWHSYRLPFEASGSFAELLETMDAQRGPLGVSVRIPTCSRSCGLH